MYCIFSLLAVVKLLTYQIKEVTFEHIPMLVSFLGGMPTSICFVLITCLHSIAAFFFLIFFQFASETVVTA